MRTLIYGGSFNPPHLGHVTAVVAALEQREVDRVLVIPSGTPPHKELAEGSPDSPRRLELCRLAFGGLPGAEICDIEIRQDDVDYTVDTLQELERQYPEDEFSLLVGTDMLLSIDTWRRHDYLLRGRTVYAMARDKGETDALREKAAQLERDWDCRVRILDKELVILSSTEVRAALKERQGQDMLPGLVYAAVIAHRWYGARPNLPWLREQAYGMLKPKRIPHVRGCEEMAVQLARRWGEDEGRAAEGAILHDIAKKFDGAEQLRLCEKYGIMTDTVERSETQLLHAKTGAALARERFGVDEGIYSAIFWHTTGRPGMSTMEKILYLADAMEPTRAYGGVEELRHLAFEDLDAAMRLGLQMSCDAVRARRQEVYHVTEEALAWFNSKKEE